MDIKFNFKDIIIPLTGIQPSIHWHSSWLTNFIKVGYIWRGREDIALRVIWRKSPENFHCLICLLWRKISFFGFSTCLPKHSSIFPILASENTQVPYHLSPRCVGSFLKRVCGLTSPLRIGISFHKQFTKIIWWLCKFLQSYKLPTTQ